MGVPCGPERGKEIVQGGPRLCEEMVRECSIVIIVMLVPMETDVGMQLFCDEKEDGGLSGKGEYLRF